MLHGMRGIHSGRDTLRALRLLGFGTLDHGSDWASLGSDGEAIHQRPQSIVNVDVAVINWVLPEAEFHGYLPRIVDAGFSDRIMFGSDNMTRPETIDIAVARTSAPFLTDEQKRDILCRNAAKFLRLGGNVCGQ